MGAAVTAMPEDNVWLTIGEVAGLLKIHPNTVRRLINTGRMAACRLGGTGGLIRIAADDLDAFLRGSRITTATGTTADADTGGDAPTGDG